MLSKEPIGRKHGIGVGLFLHALAKPKGGINAFAIYARLPSHGALVVPV